MKTYVRTASGTWHRWSCSYAENAEVVDERETRPTDGSQCLHCLG